MVDRKDVVICMPVAKSVEPETQQCLDAARDAGYRILQVHGVSAVDRARNILASRALATDCKAILWIDSDMVWDPWALEAIRGHGLPIVSAVPCRRGGHGLAVRFLPETKEVTLGVSGATLEIESAGTGFLYTSREVYEKVEEYHKYDIARCSLGGDGRIDFFPFFMPSVAWDDRAKTFSYLSEDYTFCSLARLAGFKVYADLGIRVGHLGRYCYQWEDARQPDVRGGTVTIRIGRM